MAQHDYDIANQNFPATRSDINSVLLATVTQNLGAAAPTIKFDGMVWVDTVGAPQRDLKLWDGTDWTFKGRWDVTNNRFISAGQIGLDLYVTAGGTPDVLTATLNLPLTGYVNGFSLLLKVSGDNTGPATLNVNALGNKSIKGLGNTALAAGVLKTGAVAFLVYDAAQDVFQLLTTFNSAPTAATETAAGIVELATAAEVKTATDNVRAVTPLGLAAVAAGARQDIASAGTCDLGSIDTSNLRITGNVTITSFGTCPAGVKKDVELAGILILTNNANIKLPSGANIQTAAGDTFKAVSEGGGVWKVHRYSPISGRALVEPSAGVYTVHYDSGEQAITLAGALVLAHGLGGAPKAVWTFLKCVSAEGGYNSGETVLVSPDAASNERGIMIRVDDATNLIGRFGSAGWQIMHATTGALVNITPANWKLIIRAAR